MGLGEFFTNNGKTSEEEVDVGTPAFSLTKVMSTVGGALASAIAALLLVLPEGLRDDEAVVIAVIASSTVMLLGIFWLVAADFRTRQKAREATLHFGERKPSEARFQALPTNELVLQLCHGSDEYEGKYATVEDGQVHLFGDRAGTPISVTFKESPKPK